MKNKFRLLLIPSSVIFWLVISNPLPQSLLFCLFGICTGFLTFKLPVPSLHNHSRTTRIITYTLTAILAILLCIESIKKFYATWTHINIFKIILTKLFVNYKVGLYVICSLIIIAILMFVVAVSLRIVYYTLQMFKAIDLNSLKSFLYKTINPKSIIKNLLISFGCVIIAAILGISLLTAVYCIPVNNIKDNVSKSATTIEKEGSYPSLSVWFHSQLDNWTDSVMMLTAANDTIESNALIEAVRISSGYIDEKTPSEILVSHYIDGKPFTGFSEYCRYWHGYLVLLKPLLSITDYSVIRILNSIAQGLLMVLLCWLMHKRKLTKYIIPMIITYLMLAPIVIAKSMQFSTCFYLFIIGMIVILFISDKHLNCYVGFVFLFIGIITAFFDFLTYPITTYGIPTILLLAIQDKAQLEEKLHNIIKTGIYWCIGYGGMWACKWLISFVVTGYSFSDIFSVIAFRTSMSYEQESFSVINIEWQNYLTFLTTPITFVALAMIAYFIITNKNNHYSANVNFYKIMLPYAIIGFAPVVWFAFASNHSAIHFWFTNKACAVTLLAVLFFIINAIIANEQPSLNSYNTDHK